MTNRLRPWLVTIEAARYAGQGRQPGSITVGKKADLIVCDGDPLTRIGDLA